MLGSKFRVEVVNESVRCPLLLTIVFLEFKSSNAVSVVTCFLSFDFGIVTIDPNTFVVMGDGKSQNATMNIHNTSCPAVQLDHPAKCDRHTVRIGSIGHIQSLLATFDLTGEEGKASSFPSGEKGTHFR